MLNVYKKNLSQIVLEPDNTEVNLSVLKEHINSSNGANITVDISNLNILDASKIAVMGSTAHYLKHPDGKINWIVNSKKVKEYTTSMSLGNSQFIYTR